MTSRNATADELSALRQDIGDLLREMQLSDLTADELRNVRALLLPMSARAKSQQCGRESGYSRTRRCR